MINEFLSKWDIPKELVEYFKEAYRSLYRKSREFELTEEKQDELLDRLVEESFYERLAKLRQEDNSISEGTNYGFFNDLKELLNVWRSEFKEGKY